MSNERMREKHEEDLKTALKGKLNKIVVFGDPYPVQTYLWITCTILLPFTTFIHIV